MNCKHCQGTGGVVFEADDGDDDAVPCLECEGKGYITVWMWLRDKWDWHVGYRMSQIGEWLSYSRIGNRYWRKYGKRRKAERLAASRTMFELHALHGERLSRLRKWATWVEGDDFNVQRQYRKESRMVAEADLACKIKSGKDTPNG